MQRVKGKTVIVTGSASGIGKATVLLLAEQGAKVAVTDIRDKEGEEVVTLIKKKGGTAHYWHLDIRDEKAVKRVCEEVYKMFGSLDVLVNNAAIPGVNKPTHEVTEKEWDDLMAVNVKGAFFCTKHAIPYMKKEKGGSIINVSCVYGCVGAANIPPYHASKASIRLMSKTDAMFYARENIRVNSVNPGYIMTPLLEEFAKSHPGGMKGLREGIQKHHPMGRIGDPEDVAYGILYLASDESKFITGSDLVIDGGFLAQ